MVKEAAAPARKGWVAVRVGEEKRRFEVPLGHLSHPLFAKLLEETEREFGFQHDGAIAIPCLVDHFRGVQELIDGEAAAAGDRHHHHRLPIVACFRA